MSQKSVSQKKEKVLVGMSGGVDSSVTACLLKEQGYDVIGIHLRFWTDPAVFSEEEHRQFPQNKCCTLEGLTRTRRLAHKLGIPFYVLNFEEIFKKKVVDFFVEEYGKNRTPNPCIECNRNVKFGFFLQKMKELGADYVATGHYARKMTVKDKKGRERYELWMGKDTQKDQSYFLYVLTQEKLRHILFPIGDYTKREVRALAKKFGIDEVNEQKESQNLCFFPERTHGPFLKRYLHQQAFEHGPIMTTEGHIIGEHQGLPLYTIGQRRGLGIGGVRGFQDQDGWYVVKLDKDRNALIIGPRSAIFSQELTAGNLNFIEGAEISQVSAEERAHGPAHEPAYEPVQNPARIHARIRYRSPLQAAILTRTSTKTAHVLFDHPQPAITPGQSVVFYEGEKVLGGGIIE